MVGYISSLHCNDYFISMYRNQLVLLGLVPKKLVHGGNTKGRRLGQKQGPKGSKWDLDDGIFCIPLWGFAFVQWGLIQWILHVLFWRSHLHSHHSEPLSLNVLLRHNDDWQQRLLLIHSSCGDKKKFSLPLCLLLGRIHSWAEQDIEKFFTL